MKDLLGRSTGHDEVDHPGPAFRRTIPHTTRRVSLWLRCNLVHSLDHSFFDRNVANGATRTHVHDSHQIPH